MSTPTLGSPHGATMTRRVSLFIASGLAMCLCCTPISVNPSPEMGEVKLSASDARDILKVADKFIRALQGGDSLTLHRLSADSVIPLWETDRSVGYDATTNAWLAGRRIRDASYEDSTSSSATVTFALPVRTMSDQCYAVGGGDTLGFKFVRRSTEWKIAAISRPFC